MSTVQKPEESGQEPNPIVELLGKHTKALVRVTAALTKLSARLDFLEASDKQTRKEQPAKYPEPSSPPVAFLNDGRVAINYRYFDGYDIKLREEWSGMLLSQAESSDLADEAGATLEQAASEIAKAYIERQLAKEFEPSVDEEDPDTDRGGES